jgi:hypothetical protein
VFSLFAKIFANTRIVELVSGFNRIGGSVDS